jgi:hypothetical protein
MENFLIGIMVNSSGNYVAAFSSGAFIELDSTNYEDAVLEVDLLEIPQ